MSQKAKIILPEKEVEVPILTGSEGERSIDCQNLRAQSGYITLDPGYMNTGACTSAITFIDGDKGILRYRGVPIEQMAEKSTFMETSYLLLNGKLPTQGELDTFVSDIRYHTMLQEDVKEYFNGFLRTAHPMAMIASLVCALSSYYQNESNVRDDEHDYLTTIRLLAKLPTIAAMAYKKSVGQPYVYPDNKRSYCENFLYMMFSLPAEEYHVDPDFVKALDLLFILHADHEQNCSTSTVRIVRSSLANLYASITAGICALWGPRHGGANQEVVEMLEQIRADGGNVKKFVELAKDKNSSFRLMGFGHRVYKNFDPRAKIIKVAADKLLSKMKVSDPLLDIAKELEEAALKDSYFVERKLYPNVDFYSGIIYKAMGIPVNFFTVMFALGRLPGWLAQAKECVEDTKLKIGRPRQIYTGPTAYDYIPIGKR